MRFALITIGRVADWRLDLRRFSLQKEFKGVHVIAKQLWTE